MTKTTMDVWHFVWDESEETWTWQRVSPTGQALAESPYAFRSFNACVADAARAGYDDKATPSRRVRSSELQPLGHAPERRLRRRRAA
jgi:hypothetical protein